MKLKYILSVTSVALLFNFSMANADNITDSQLASLNTDSTQSETLIGLTAAEQIQTTFQQTEQTEDKVILTTAKTGDLEQLAYSDGIVLDNYGLYAKILAPQDEYYAYGYGSSHSGLAYTTDLRVQYTVAYLSEKTFIAETGLDMTKTDKDNPSGTYTAQVEHGLMFSSGSLITSTIV